MSSEVVVLLYLILVLALCAIVLWSYRRLQDRSQELAGIPTPILTGFPGPPPPPDHEIPYLDPLNAAAVNDGDGDSETAPLIPSETRRASLRPEQLDEVRGLLNRNDVGAKVKEKVKHLVEGDMTFEGLYRPSHRDAS